jgi:hypothetical protein
VLQPFRAAVGARDRVFLPERGERGARHEQRIDDGTRPGELAETVRPVEAAALSRRVSGRVQGGKHALVHGLDQHASGPAGS